MRKLLIVDDAPINRAQLADIFADSFDIYEACDGVEACELIDKYDTDFALILLDYVMPRKNGLEVLEFLRLRNLIEHIPVIMITGEATIEAETKAYEYGVADIIYKPFAAPVVLRRAQNLIELFKKHDETEKELRQRTRELIESREALANTNEFLLDALGSVVEFRSLESGEHIQRVKKLTKIILQYVRSTCPSYNLSTKDIDMMASASALHDVGKIAVSDGILNAPRKLSVEEFAEMKKHTLYGCDILERFKMQNSDFFKYTYEICRWHHEKVDGKGYPDGLKGDDIPIYCQAASLADCFDALVSKRVYKDAQAPEKAFEMIKNGECGAFSEVMMTSFEMARRELFEAVS